MQDVCEKSQETFQQNQSLKKINKGEDSYLNNLWIYVIGFKCYSFYMNKPNKKYCIKIKSKNLLKMSYSFVFVLKDFNLLIIVVD